MPPFFLEEPSCQVLGPESANMSKQKFWERELPEGHKEKHLTHKQVQRAKARARVSGRPYPNLIDNAAVARSAKGKGK